MWGHAVALHRTAEGQAPEWIQILPAGVELRGRDGRTFRNPRPETLVEAFAAHAGPIAIDYEHAQHHLAPQGIEAPAAGWIEAVELRDGQLWGRVEWTPKAKASIEAREYRFFSPEFAFAAASKDIVEILGGALVNRPNFVMTALNNRQDPPMLKEIAAALGLPEAATVGECVMGIAALKAEKAVAVNAAATPDLTRFVPRADLETALNRATTAEAALAAVKTADAETAITRAVDEAIRAGKVAPASKDYYLAACRAEGGLDRFRAHVAGLPSHFAPSGLDKRDPEAGTGAPAALNAEERAVCRAMGIPEDKFAAHLAARKAAAAAAGA